MAETHHELIGRLAHVLALLSDTDSIVDRLCEAGRQMLDADGAAITLRMDGRHRVTVSATDDLAAKLEDLQDVVGEGPSIDAVRTGSLVVAKFGDDTDEQWSLMYDRGYRTSLGGTILAVPLRAVVKTFGSLTVHRRAPVRSADDITGRFLGVAVGTALPQDPQLHELGQIHSELWSSRAQVHQATGIVAQVSVSPEDALALLRGQAFAQNMTLLDVAQQVVDRTINFRHFVIGGD